jgi:hypothetical protein
MCVTALIALGAGTGMQAFGQYRQGREQESQLNYQAGMARADALAAEGVAQVEAKHIRRATTMQRKEARAAYGASGVDVNSGTALDVQGDILARGEYDALSALLTGSNRAARLRQSAEMFARGAHNARVSGNLGALATVLQGAGQAGWMYSMNPKPSLVGEFTTADPSASLGLSTDRSYGQVLSADRSYGTGLRYRG